MRGSDERQTQDERTLEQDPAEDVREEYTTYRATGRDDPSPEDAAAKREADLQPGPSQEEGETRGGDH